jgi:multiple sugar transport system permease protein
MGGYNMVLYLAGLQGIDPELYEAAGIDGANKWQKFWNVTWPMLTPTTFFIFIMSMMGGFQGGFDAAYVMTGGGPAGSTTTIMYYIYNNAFQWFKMGYAAAIAWVLFILVFIVTLINWKVGGKLVHY